MDYIRARLREPSTWAGLGVLYVAVESALSSGNWQAGAAGILAALLAVLMGDKKAV